MVRMAIVGADIRNSKEALEYSGNSSIISGMPLDTAMVEQMIKDKDKMPMISGSLCFILIRSFCNVLYSCYNYNHELTVVQEGRKLNFSRSRGIRENSKKVLLKE